MSIPIVPWANMAAETNFQGRAGCVAADVAAVFLRLKAS
jgi:hypothetical protein